MKIVTDRMIELNGTVVRFLNMLVVCGIEVHSMSGLPSGDDAIKAARELHALLTDQPATVDPSQMLLLPGGGAIEAPTDIGTPAYRLRLPPEG